MRAYGQTNRPPPFSTTGPDKILIQRRNRYVGLSSEGMSFPLPPPISLAFPYAFFNLLGTVCVDWPTKKSSKEFDIHMWPKLFLGIYLLLAQQV